MYKVKMCHAAKSAGRRPLQQCTHQKDTSVRKEPIRWAQNRHPEPDSQDPEQGQQFD